LCNIIPPSLPSLPSLPLTSPLPSPLLSSPPLSSMPGIQAGARSGLSTIVCGVLFLLSSLMTSFWASIPDTGIATVLLIVGFLFFDHTSTVDWKNTKEGLPTFTTCIMTAFSCSVLNGAVIGTLMHVLLALTTDYADNMTERVMKSVFRGWDWVWGTCWSADYDDAAAGAGAAAAGAGAAAAGGEGSSSARGGEFGGAGVSHDGAAAVLLPVIPEATSGENTHHHHHHHYSRIVCDNTAAGHSINGKKYYQSSL
jgi:hypothetical protein